MQSSSSSSLPQVTGLPENWSVLSSGCRGADNSGRAGVAFDVVSSLIRLQTPRDSIEWHPTLWLSFIPTEALGIVRVNPPMQENFYFGRRTKSTAASKIDNLTTTLLREMSEFRTVEFHESRRKTGLQKVKMIFRELAFILPGQELFCMDEERNSFNTSAHGSILVSPIL